MAKKRHPLTAPFLAMVAHFDDAFCTRTLALEAIRLVKSHLPKPPAAGRLIEWPGPGKEAKYRLTPAELERFRTAPDDPERVLAECPMPGFRLDQRDVEIAWSIDVDPGYWTNIQERSGMVRHDLGPAMRISINDLALRSYDICDPKDWLDPTALRAWRKAHGGNAASYALPLAVAAYFDANGAWYALFDIDRPREIGFGTYYLGAWMGPFTWRRVLEHDLWYGADEDRKNHVRGLYWGQYLGPRLAQKLDPDGSSLAEFEGRWPGAEFLQPIVHRFDSGGAFLALTGSPLHALEYVYGTISPATPAAALHRQFRKRGLYL
ncbi:MAG: hypothetical protein ACF8R7_02850 [Phycisphaerales bacterium JB039]